jgi:hypothetical protein
LQTWERVLIEVELKDGCYDDTDKATEEVAEDEGSRLSKRDVYGTVTKDGGSALSAGKLIPRKLRKKTVKRYLRMKR